MAKNGHAAALGRLGGKAAWKNIPDSERSRILKARAAKRKKAK
jgi:hypothetical protein